MSVTNLTGTTWIFYFFPSVVQNYNKTFDITFLTTSSQHTSITISDYNGTSSAYMKYDNQTIFMAYHGIAWDDHEENRVIHITGGLDVGNQELIGWLEENAVYQEPEITKIENTYIGNLPITKAFIGSSKIKNMYLGDKKIYGEGEPSGEIIVTNDCITFSSPNPFIFAFSPTNCDGVLKYSVDKIHWKEIDSFKAIQSGSDNKIYLLGSGNTRLCNTYSLSGVDTIILIGTNISCSGNIECLLDYETVSLGNHPHMSSSAFAGLFKTCSALISAPDLGAVDLVYECYYGMFALCTNLIAPAKIGDGTTKLTAASSACLNMYNGCTSLNIYTTPIGHTSFYKTMDYSTTQGETDYRSTLRMFYNCKIDGATSLDDYLQPDIQLYY